MGPYRPFPKKWMIIALAAALWGAGACHAAAQEPTRGELFEFHSGFWINLHHFLYFQAHISEPQKWPQNLSLIKADNSELERLSPAERKTWDESLAYYRQSVVKRDLLFDDGLIETKNRLEDAEGSSDLAKVNLPDRLKAVLLQAAPVYRNHWWPKHDAANRQWIDRLDPLIKRYGARMSVDLSRIYEEPWPQYPVRVDAVAYANWAGAYTTIGPTRPTISTTDPGNQGFDGLEILFHETSHGMVEKLRDAMQLAETRRNDHRPEAFHVGSAWHAVLFYTAGELMVKQFRGYVPYAEKNGLWVRAWPPPVHSLIERDWQPHLDGTVTLEQAATKLVDDLAGATLKTGAGER